MTVIASAITDHFVAIVTDTILHKEGEYLVYPKIERLNDGRLFAAVAGKKSILDTLGFMGNWANSRGRTLGLYSKSNIIELIHYVNRTMEINNEPLENSFVYIASVSGVVRWDLLYKDKDFYLKEEAYCRAVVGSYELNYAGGISSGRFTNEDNIIDNLQRIIKEKHESMLGKDGCLSRDPTKAFCNLLIDRESGIAVRFDLPFSTFSEYLSASYTGGNSQRYTEAFCRGLPPATENLL